MLRKICVTFHVIAWDFRQFARKNISECSISTNAGCTRAVALYQQWYREVPPVVHKSTNSGTRKYQQWNSAGTHIPSVPPSKGKCI